MEIAAMIFQYAVLGALGGVCVAAWGLVKQYNLEKWVNLAVTAWEMYAPQAKRGEFKKERVSGFLKGKFPKVDVRELDMMIEKAVLEMNKNIRP
jgi:hypothetical protein